MGNKLCDKLLNGKDQHRDTVSIALKTIVSEIATGSLAQRLQDTLGPQLIKGITSPVRFSKFLLLAVHGCIDMFTS